MAGDDSFEAKMDKAAASLTPEERQQAEESENIARMLAGNWDNACQLMGIMGIRVTIPTIVHACAIIYASCLAMSDDKLTHFEQESGQLVTDDDRLKLFVMEVKERVGPIRMARAEAEAEAAGKIADDRPTGKRRSTDRRN